MFGNKSNNSKGSQDTAAYLETLDAEGIKQYARKHFQSVLDLPEAKGRESIAVGLAKSGMSLDEAKKTLSMVPGSVSENSNRLQQFVEQKRSENNGE